MSQQLPPLEIRVTREQLVRYAGASGDFNPIHYSDHFATALGLDGVVAHGMLTMGLGLRVVTDWCGDPARVVTYSFRFRRPVPVPDDADGTLVSFTATAEDAADGIIPISVQARVAGTVVGSGKAEVRA
ncbi:MaoC/PaaZ C-terminal domain-containing protein [Granulicoccus phenolivorans]|uniref:MaoC/PaaZ C-terminal domain-containing protein n=1 Tax=Granulicoccus phenolivorans TaxID=266854 RepID=UPI000420D00A|nr:MaoC/PaaZ C-terminal domain-containing protein [Granulicoccus phenolivorans]